MAASNINRIAETHDDMIGYINTGLAGANQWVVANVRDTLFPLQFLKNNSNDFYCCSIQSPHDRKQGANLDSLHIHYLLNSAYTGNQTLVFDISYAWIIPGTTFPAIASWTVLTGVSKVLSTGNLAQYYTDIASLVTNIAPPSPEGYGVAMAIKVVRGNGTYTGDLGIWAMDLHYVSDRQGSVNEFTD
jgi:hypothetical protein